MRIAYTYMTYVLYNIQRFVCMVVAVDKRNLYNKRTRVDALQIWMSSIYDQTYFPRAV